MDQTAAEKKTVDQSETDTSVEYQTGSLSQLITKKSRHRKRKRKNVITSSTDTPVTSVSEAENKLDSIFNDPSASNYSLKQTQAVSTIKISTSITL